MRVSVSRQGGGGRKKKNRRIKVEGQRRGGQDEATPRGVERGKGLYV